MREPPDLSGVRHEFIGAGGLRMHVAVAGKETAPPVLLVHGWPQNWWVWRNVIPALAGRFRVIAPDLRGHGWSDAPSGGYDKEQLASDLLALLDTLGIERVTWIGHDWGGWTGFLAALRAPERVERMLCLCIPHLWTDPDPRQFLLLLSYQAPISLPIAGGRIAAAMVPRILQAGRGPSKLADDDVAVFADNLPNRVSVAMYRTFLTRELPSVAAGRYRKLKLQTPTTLLLGERDLVTKSITTGPVEGQPRLRVAQIGEVAHWLPEQRSEAVIEWAEAG